MRASLGVSTRGVFSLGPKGSKCSTAAQSFMDVWRHPGHAEVSAARPCPVGHSVSERTRSLGPGGSPATGHTMHEVPRETFGA